MLTPENVNTACREGDEAALEIIRASGQMIGDVLAGIVNFFNPGHIFIGGGIANFGNHLLIAIKRAVLRQSLPLATTNLAISFSRDRFRCRCNWCHHAGIGVSLRGQG